MGFFSEIGDFLENPLNYAGESLGKLNHDASKQTWDYQTSNAYQNTAKDLKAAGLNPMLSYMNGANSASVSQANVNQLGSPVSSALGVAQQGLDLRKTMLESDLISNNARSAKANADIETSVANQILKNPKIIEAMATKRGAPTNPIQGIGQTFLSNLGDKVVKGISDFGASVSNSAKGAIETGKNAINSVIQAGKAAFNSLRTMTGGTD